MTLSLPAIFWLTLVIQLLGLGSIVAQRLCGTARGRRLCQQMFVSMLLAMGLITVLAMGADSDCWVTSGASLSIMTVCASLDFRREGTRSPVF